MTELGGIPDLDDLTPEQWEQIGLTHEEFKKQIAQAQEREKIAPGVGNLAPDFSLKRLSKEGKLTEEYVRLSDLRGRPVALVFGSYT